MKNNNSHTQATFEKLAGLSSSREIAISAGELSVAVRNKVDVLLTGNRNNIFEAFKAGMQELLEKDLISAQEFESLQDIFRLFIDAIREKGDIEDAFFAIRKTYNQMLLDQECSTIALAIASVINSSWKFEKSNSIKITPETTGSGAAVGAAIGGAMGAGFGGLPGAAVGAAIGAIAGAAIGLCNEKGV